jgi:outer membrane protein TolC
VALNLNIFNLGTDSRIASARGRAIRARDARDALRRDLEHQVQQALLDYGVALERNRVAQSALESATENLNLTQQKYNVGSATILELIDAQVQLQRARSDGVSAQAAIRVAEAQIDRVRGRAE